MHFRVGSYFYRIVFAAILVFANAASAIAATESLLHEFVNTQQGAYPQSALVADPQGNLYGTTVYGGTHGFGTVFKLTPNSSGGWNQNVLHSFTGYADGAYPDGNVVLDAAGHIYGATTNGGNLTCSTGCGVVFELSLDGGGTWKEKVLHTFTATNGDGAYPNGSLVFDSGGSLYGTANEGGLNTKACGSTCGIVFRLSPSKSGWKETILYQFTGGQDGANPAAGVVFDSQGNLYGTTSGYDVYSTVFELSHSSNAWTFATLHTFNSAGDGSRPNGLTLDAAGNVYGTTWNGGANGWGAVFELAQSQGSWTESVLYSFQITPDGITPRAGVVLDASGNLYGTTSYGGANGGGAVFELAQNHGLWTEKILYSFQAGKDGTTPYGSVLRMPNGDLLGTTQQGSENGFGTVFDLTPSGGAYREKRIYTFPATDGDFVHSGLIADGAGNLYGTTRQGGLNQCPTSGFSYSGCGTVFELTRLSDGKWQRTIIHAFTHTAAGPEDACPEGDLIFDAAGNLYGTTSGCLDYNAGAVFELSPTSGGGWTFNFLYRFGSNPNDGSGPFGSLVFDAAGDLYGTTRNGGSHAGLNCNPCGSVFKLTPSQNGTWTESVIYNFRGGQNDGCDPLGGLVIDSAGNLYGSTSGNSGQCPSVVFKLSPNSDGSWAESALYAFSGTGDGFGPQGRLIFDSSGNLYGTASAGGNGGGYCGAGGCGVVFELSPSSGRAWTETVLYTFTGIPDGEGPLAGLTFDAAGNLYGTTEYGGLQGSTCVIIGCGTLFELTPAGGAWAETVLYSFAGSLSDGANPTSTVILDSAGNIYGTTSVGGIDSFNGGTIFQFVP